MHSERSISAHNLGQCQQALADLARRAAAIDLRAFEDASLGDAWQQLPPIASDLLVGAATLVGDLIEACGQLQPRSDAGNALDNPFFTFERAMDEAVASGSRSIAAVEDIAFLVQLELRQRRERLGRVTAAAGAHGVLYECDSALRRIRKGLGAIDVAISRALGTEPLLDFSSELETSLRVRAAYAKLRLRLIGSALDADAENLYSRMRAAGTQLAIVVGWEAYPLLRVRDRLQLRELQSRILTWLRPEHRGDRLGGMRLWQDVVAFIEMLSLVNRRQELLEHDGRIIAELTSALTDGGTPVAEVARKLERLQGLDPELDQLIANQAPERAPLVDVLTRLAPKNEGFR